MTVWFISLVICSTFFWMVPLLKLEQMEPHQALQWSLGQHFYRDSVDKGFLFLSDFTFLYFTAMSCYYCQAEVAIVASAGAAVAAKFPSKLMFIVSSWGSVMGVLIIAISLLGLFVQISSKKPCFSLTACRRATLPQTQRLSRATLLLKWLLKIASSCEVGVWRNEL